AQRGAKGLLVERGEYPGAKNMFGGMMAYCPAPEELVPGFWDQAPWERAVIKRVLSVAGEGSSTSLVFQAHSDSTLRPAGAGSTSDRTLTAFTLFRPFFDRWYAEQAVARGVTLLTSCRADGLVIRDGMVRGIRISGDSVEAPLVIACDGTLSFLAQEAGLHTGFRPDQVALGVRALYHLTEEEINERFGLLGREGATQEFLGCTEGIRGGGFIYTQTETLSVGLVLHLDSIKSRSIPPYELLERFVASSQVASLLRGARLMEYSAHLLPEAGMRVVPKLCAAGLLVAGDAAGFCYTNGLTQEGMNLAMTSGLIAAQAGAAALAEGDFSARKLARYREKLKKSFVLRDLATFSRAIDFLHHDRLFAVYPRVVSALMEDLYRSDGTPKEKIGKLGRRAIKDEVTMRQLLADLFQGGRAFLW
ncbi:MAG: FAD-dependent oxidoreductase, partial [Actinobacteria bacterium]|nr:FAD-dependent oxidoreductase [Actinomycetota bacterium]